MVIRDQKVVTCPHCKQEFYIREYVGLEGGWYTDHHCEETRQAALKVLSIKESPA